MVGAQTQRRGDPHLVDYAGRVSAKQELEALTASFSAREWRWLGAIAAEQGLGKNVLSRIDGDASAFVGASLETGLLVAINGSEVAIHPRFEQLVLRAVAERGELTDIAEETRALLETRSVSHIALALQTGDLGEFLRRVALRRLPRTLPYPSAAEWLRASVCTPFDPEWLERTWGTRASELATRVLREALDGPCAVHGLYEWMLERREAIDDDELGCALAEHAFLRGEEVLLDELAGPRQGYRAASRFLLGDVGAAQKLIDRALGRSKRSPLDSYGAVAPLLALLLIARDDDASTANAKRVIAAGDPGAARALRTLLKYLAQPGVAHRRIDVHQLEANTGAWELLLTAFTVELHLDQPWARASWAQHVARRAIEWRNAGYAWLAKQALLLAHALNAEYCARELTEHGVDGMVLRCRPRELRVWDLITTKPDWKKTLEALERVSEAVFEQGELTRRVAWFVDMTDGSFAKPALQEHRDGGGFTPGQRLTIAELYELRQELPPEDQRVLECSRATRDGHRELTPDAHEMLIGHPRVFNGARGMQPVEVVRGSCRLETEEDSGHIRIIVEPEGARLGVNVVPESEARLVVYRVSATMQRVIDALPHGVRIPRSHEPEVTRILGRLAENIEVRSAQLGAERSVDPDSAPCVRIAPRAGAWSVQLGVRPFGDKGRFFVAGSGRASIMLHQDGERLRCVRDLSLERARVDALIAECPALRRDEQPVEDGFVFGEEDVLALLSELRDAETAHALEWPESSALRLRGQVTAKTLHGRLRSKKGWYLVTGGVALDDVTEVALSELASAPAVGNGRFLRLSNGDYVEVEARVRRVVSALAAFSARLEGEIPIHRAALASLPELTEEGNGLAIEPDVDAWVQRFSSVAEKTYPVPATLRADLRPYQHDGFQWLCRMTELGVGACLADDMGLGKTVQIIALLLTRADFGPALVVAPTSVCANWKRELERFAPSLNAIEYVGADRDAALASLKASDVLICSYALLQQDEEKLAAVEYATAILDEAQFIKNAESLRARAAYRISAKQRIAATGTPVENHYGDLWSIFRFLEPGLLGDWAPFRRRFVHPKESGSSDGGDAPELVLKRMIQPYVLRRRKTEVLTELPPLTEVQHDVHLSHEDALRYAYLRREINEKLFTSHGRRNSKLEILAEIQRLRRFCCHPRLVFPDAPAESAKIDAFLDLVEELHENGHRALVFSQYVDFLSLVREQLDERAIRYEYLDGSTPNTQRQARVDAFQNGDAPLFLISLKAGGFGLNLTAADYVIHLDPWWNPAVEAQATDRAHRIGQERRVTVYRLVTRNTIEEEIVKLHGKKQRLARALLDEGGNASADDLLALVGD